MKILHSIALGILLAFTAYYYFIVLFLDGNRDELITATVLGFSSLSLYQTIQTVKYKTLYESEKKKNDDFVRGINEVKSLVHKALVNKN